MTKTYEIYWDDLTPEARERLSDLHHKNVDMSPLAIIEIEDITDQLLTGGLII